MAPSSSNKRRKLDSPAPAPSRGSSPAPPHLHLSSSSSVPSASSSTLSSTSTAPTEPPSGQEKRPAAAGQSSRSEYSTSSALTSLTTASKGRPKLKSSESGSASGLRVTKGDTIELEGYRDVRVFSTHYDDTILCRAVSSHRNDARVFLKFSTSARPSAGLQFKAEQQLLGQLREQGVRNVGRVLGREMGRLGAMLVISDDLSLLFLSELYLSPSRLSSPSPSTGYWISTPLPPPSPSTSTPQIPPPPPPPPANHLPSLLRLTLSLLSTLSSLHALHLVHGSLRPTSISLSTTPSPSPSAQPTAPPTVLLHDFSCAFRSSTSTGDSNPIRERGMREESLPFLAPECSGRTGKTADWRSDYYSLGATLFTLLTGRPPFSPRAAIPTGKEGAGVEGEKQEATGTEQDALSLIHAHIAVRPPLADTLDPSVPHELALVVAKLLEKAPEERYQTSGGLRVDLERVLELLELGGGAAAGEEATKTHTQPSFPIGAIDSSATFRLPPSSTLYGRSSSVSQLLEAYERVKSGGGGGGVQVVVVKGVSGIGKTSLVERVREPALEGRGRWAGVKFDQIKSPVPFFAISQALTSLLRQTLSSPSASLLSWRRRLSTALGKEGRVLADVLPTLELVFEDGWLEGLPPVVPLGAKESEQRFREVVLRVLKCFAREGKPLVLVFDDLQWSTPSDISFLLSLLAPPSPTPRPIDSPLSSSPALTNSSPLSSSSPIAPAPSHPILLICLYRDNEVGPEHIVATTLLPQLPPRRLEIQLHPLGLDDVVRFVGESLRTPGRVGVASKEGEEKEREKEEERDDPNLRTLSEVILSRTQGSPLFVAQLLKALNAEGMFTFDFSAGRWQFDLDQIAYKSISTDVVELLLAQMMKFAPATRRALMVAACLGNEELSASSLAEASGRTLAELSADLHEAVEEGMLVPIGEIDKSTEVRRPSMVRMDTAGSERTMVMEIDQEVEERELKAGEGKEEETEPMRPKKPMRSSSTVKVAEFYRFFHDRCQQAAYALVPVADRPQMHYQIGQRLVASLSDEALHDRIFDLANQLNYGIEILSSTDERDELARFNYIAATKASRATAFEGARKYLQIAWDLLGTGGWVGQPTLMAQVTEALVEVEYSLTDYPASQEYVRIFLDHSRDTVAKLRVYARSIRSASAMGDSSKAIEIGREGLAMVGVQLPDDTEAANALSATIRTELGFTSESIASLCDRPRMIDPVICGAQQVMAALIPPIYFTRIDLLGALSSLAARETSRHGIDDAGSLLFTLLAVLVHGMYGELEESLAYGKTAIQFFERYGGTPLACPTYKVYSSHIVPWSMPIRDSFPSFRTAIAYGIEYRDAEYVGFGCGELSSYSILSGVPLPEISSNLERFTVLVRKFRHELSTLYIAIVHQAALCLTGRATDALELEGEAFSVTDYHICEEKQYGVSLHLFHVLRLMIAVFFDDLKRAKESVKIGRLEIDGAQGLIYPVFFQTFESVALFDQWPDLTTEEHEILAANRKAIEALAITQADNFSSLKLWLDAEAARAKGDLKEALLLYDEAIAAALAVEYIHIAACMNERCAKMLKTPKLAAGYLIEARDLWSKWGCEPKITAMTRAHPKLFSSEPSLLPRADDPAATAVPTETNGNASHSALPPAEVHSEQSTPDDGDRASTHREETQSAMTWTYERPGRPKRTPSSGSHSHSHSTNEGQDILSEHRGSVTGHTEPMPRSHLATELDLRTVVSASSVISMELSVDGVVSKLLSLALRTAGAEMCLLVLDKGGTLCAEAIARSTSSEIQHLRRRDAIDVQPERYPCSVINYVARSRAMVVNSLDALGETITDPYLKQQKPLSILCLALVNQQRVVGVMYLENSQTRNAFTPDRLEILSLVSGQAAATIEKSRLVQDLKAANADLQRSQAALEGYNRNLEGTVADRTLELQQKNDLLRAEVAEKERAQAEMRSAKDVAESATQMKSQFLANMSHEIRTPFNAVVALAGLLLDTSLTPVQTDYVETIKNSSQELLVVINDILDYSKIELDHLELSKDTVQLRNVLESSMDMLAERAASKQVEMALVIEEGDINILGDLTRLRQIVVNLLSNAVKFTSDGEIIVTAKSEAASRSEKGDEMCRVTIAVKDSGIGIAQEHFSRLFRVFSQAEGSETTKQFGGTGLGLAISRKLSLLMGGDIEVTSEVGKGSTFTATIVVPRADPPDTDLYAAAQNPDLVGKKCLIVDDNVTSRLVLKQLVTSFGLVPEAPEDVSDAFRVAVEAMDAGRPHHVIIVDAFLPSFAANILLRRLRQRSINSPVIALTRMGSPIYEEMRQLDCKFLIKPIKRNRLHHTLRQVFPATSEFRKASPPPPAASPFPVNMAVRCPLSILCAEDNPINVKVITHLLKRIGYTTDVAEDGVIALEKVQKKRYDLLLTDISMPNKSGLELTRDIITLWPEPNQRPFIVCLTANAMSGDKEACLAAGADGYVSKPILVPALLEALNGASTKVQKQRAALGLPDVPEPPPVPSRSLTPVQSPLAPPSLTASSSFELELPTSRLGRASRASSHSRGGSIPRSATSSPSGSPDPTYKSIVFDGAGPPVP